MNQDQQEIEVKFYVERLKVVEGRLREQGGELVQPRVNELNLRFDTPDRDLSRGYRVLRLRQDNRARLTYKGPGASQEGIRIRQEIEFEVSDFDAARDFLQALGYQVNMIYEKFRTTYRLDGCEIVLDELPYGNFVEIEGPDADTIRAVNEKLGLNWDASVNLSYVPLFEALCKRMNLPFRDLTFQNFRAISVTPGQLGVRPADLISGTST